MQRALRSSALTLINFGSGQFIRLAANLVLTRLLFPEAFGIMALASVTIVALNQFSDIGVIPSIIRSKRGDDPEFLDTAWTLKIIRSFILFAIACAIAWPLSVFYSEPLLAQIIPLLAVSILFEGFIPTKRETALRNIQHGRMTVLDISANLIGVSAMILLAWYLGSIWALPIGTVVGSLGRLTLYHFFMPGRRNSFAFERSAASELIHFGKWIFPATIATFLIIEADKFLLGRYVSFEMLGIYNIGFFLASFPLIIARMLGGRVMVSYFKNASEELAEGHAQKTRKLMFILFGGLSVAIFPMVIVGQWLVDFLYDDRYLAAGMILVTLTSMQILQIAQIPYQNALLGLGRGKDYFLLLSSKAFFVIVSIWVGLEYFGLLGAVLGQGVAMVLSYPIVVYYARKMNVFDPLFDLVLYGIAGLAIGTAWWLYSDRLAELIVY